MNLHDALAEQVFDQRKDRPGVARQEPANGGEIPVDVVLSPANRTFTPSMCPKPRTASHSSPLARPVRDASFSSIVSISHGLDDEAPADRPGHEVVDRHDVLRVRVRGVSRNDDRARSLSRRHEVVFAQSSQRFADGVAAHGESLAQIILGRELRSHRIHAADDFLLQGARDLEIERVVGFDVGRRATRGAAFSGFDRCAFVAIFDRMISLSAGL